MGSVIKKILNNKVFWVIIGITLVGAFLRVYHFEEWMHYQLDQARDYRVIHAAIEYGPGELPLQGPRAAGSFLRLGPLLYYLEYVSALVFGDSPAGSIAVIFYLNVFAIPLFYFFVRRFFHWQLAAGLSAIFAVSLFMITYSRFGWNPTLIPFFVILYGYALLRVSDAVDTKAGWWLVVASGALAFVVNMHFVALAIAPLFGAVFLLWTRPVVALRYWFLAVVVFVFLNVPLIVNDIKTGGDNIAEFFAVVADRGGEDNRTLVDKVVYNAGQHTQYLWMIVTGDQMAGVPALKGSDIQCDYDCRHGLIRGVLSAIVVIFGIVAWAFLYRVEEHMTRKNFLRLIAVWSVITFVVYTPLAYDLAPRFYLLNAPIAFIIIGLIVQAITVEYRRAGYICAIVMIGACIVANLFYVGHYFHQLSRAATDPTLVIPHHDRILKETTRVTLGQMEQIVDWIEQKHKENNYPVFVEAQAEYKRAFWERIDIRDIPRDGIPSDGDPLYRESNYFVIIRTQSDQEKFLEKYRDGLNIVETRIFGTLTVYNLMPKEEMITEERKKFTPDQRDPKFSKGVQPRYLWRQVFEGCTYSFDTDKCE